MSVRYIWLLLIFYSCIGREDFLAHFKDRGELQVELIGKLDGNLTTGITSMLKVGDRILWSEYGGDKGTMLHIFDLGKNEWKEPLKDSIHTYCSVFLYEYNDSTVLIFNNAYQFLAYVHLRDRVYISDSSSLKIENEGFYDRAGRMAMYSICPGNDSLIIVGRMEGQSGDYGVYDRKDRMLYVSQSCLPPTPEDTRCVLPDRRLVCHTVRQKGKNRFAIFRNYYQLYDIIEMQGNTLRLLNRCTYHYSILTGKDQYNLGKDLAYDFFPGFFVQSSRYIMPLYQSEKAKEGQFLLILDWEGKPLDRFHFPKHLQIKSICGDNENLFYAVAKNEEGYIGLYRVRRK